jgi:hypothetical protein
MSGYYFSHDYASRSDDKVKALIRRHGMLGYGIFWAIVEDLYLNGNRMRADPEGIAFDLRTDTETVRSILHDFELFTHDAEYFGSASIGRRLEERESKTASARKSASYRWQNANAMRTHSERNANASENDANAMRVESSRNAIKEIKGKERKGKEINKRESNAAFAAPALETVVAFAETEGIGSRTAPQDFHDYYTSNGWKVGGRAAMKDWKAAFKRWTRNEKTYEHGAYQQQHEKPLSSRRKGDIDAIRSWGQDIIDGRVDLSDLFGGSAT